ncbi:MAG: GNAT family N-acetyltransferase [Chlorobi bacterium]|nr:GNAT family N-acetyltransferase [Chlorobiota bacterium]
MKFIETEVLSQEQKQEMFELWNNEYPDVLAYSVLTEFEDYLNKLINRHYILLVDDAGKVKGWYFEFTRDDEKWFVLIVGSEIQNRGYGSQLLEKGKSRSDKLNGWVIDHNNYKKLSGEPYLSPLGFYVKNGFKVLHDNVLKTEKISAVQIEWQKDYD